MVLMNGAKGNVDHFESNPGGMFHQNSFSETHIDRPNEKEIKR